MTLMAAGNPLPVVLEAIVLSVEAEDPGIVCSILLLDDAGERAGGQRRPEPAQRL